MTWRLWRNLQQACTCAERREVNKALTGENSVFTRRGRNSERGATFGHNESRSRIPPISAGRSMVAQETIEMPTIAVATQKGREEAEVATNRSDDDGSSSPAQQPAANGSFKMDESITRSQTSNPDKEGTS